MFKLATRMANNYTQGDYTRWSYAYPWMITYISSWSADNILGYTGLARFVDQFPLYHEAMNKYVQKEITSVHRLVVKELLTIRYSL
jgi:hypothetical protein